MAIEQLVGPYVRLRQELELAFLLEACRPGRQGLITRLSRELGQVEEELQRQNVSDDLFVALVSGTSGLEQVLIDRPRGQRPVGLMCSGMRR